MSEFFLELFSEEIPSSLQTNLRSDLLNAFKDLFEKKTIKFKNSTTYSTPNRLIILFEGVEREITLKSEEIKGPNIKAPNEALEGFLRSNNLDKSKVYKKKTDKGEFYFYKTSSKKLNTHSILEVSIPEILKKIQWKKSMKWGNFELNWARPLKSILAVFDKKKISFKFGHLNSSNVTFVDKEFEDKTKIFLDFKTYNKDSPNLLICEFDKKFLNIPKEILTITMQYHQKYFPSYDAKGNITNEFVVVANKKDSKGLIKIGNERVVEARLSDAEFFWKKDKSQNLVKSVSKLKNINYFKGLGSYFDKVQRMRKLGGMISDELLISKEKVELSASISKVDLLSDLVGEFPELQGVMGGYFAEAQGFDKEITQAISEQYLPIGLESQLPKKPFSIALSISDKIDTLVGFFGINQKPTSSKDPYALRRLALGIVRTIVENKKDFKIRGLIDYSINLYLEQGFEFSNKNLQKELQEFLMERLKYYLKEKKIRQDIAESCISVLNIDNSVIIFRKASCLNKVINKPVGKDIIASYKRAYSILDSEQKNGQLDLSNTTDPGIFKSDFEKNLFKKINELRKYFSSINKDEDFEQSLANLAGAKKLVFEFFDNVIVNEQDQSIKKNRLELIQMLCKTFENYTNFSVIEAN
ncbi:MAG: glycine--tRNA ligase subunit beta [Proteobacteria bacterium]|nr:glycine--tRNA ligase subunit beta [Pseudomonadota bacterium]